ncbi:MAG TPA: hydrogenase nickel incorporation protein HypB [Anaerolineae bacterium]|jgi:hydrogenase nickel incorporation protein HypB|nr:hydrogenase nickel incorporation protein HypB [Anaerolineae bacterium]
MRLEIKVLQDIFAANEGLASENAELFKRKGVFVINLMASPGAGKTSFILGTIGGLRDKYNIAVIEGDVASKVDAEKIKAHGVQSIQINTGGGCHLEANMIKQAIEHLDLDDIDLLIIENVGNLVCPADFNLGESARIVILSVPEGDDKPLKYPFIFRDCDVLIVNKIDMVDLTDFSMERLEEAVRNHNPDVEMLPLSCRSGTGFDLWLDWVEKRLKVRDGNG